MPIAAASALKSLQRINLNSLEALPVAGLVARGETHL